MRSLVISGYPPSTPEDSSHGIFKRLETFVDALAAEGEVDLLFFAPAKVESAPEERESIERACRERWGDKVRVFVGRKRSRADSRGFANRYLKPALRVSAQANFDDFSGPTQIGVLEKCLARRPDVLFAHRLESMLLVMAARRSVPPVLYDVDDVEHVKFLRFMRQPPFWPSKILLYLQWPVLFLSERRAIRFARAAFVCSDTDRTYLRDRRGFRNVEVVPNAVRMPGPSPVPHDRRMLFLGNFGYGPNASAAEYLASGIWPRVREAVPDAKLILAGRKAERLRLPHEAGIDVRGFVTNLDDLYRGIRVVACPILAGGGTRFKIIEAAAYGRPIVSTTLGAEGIPLVDGREIRLADSAEQFAAACIALLEDHEACEALASECRSKAMRLYDRERIVERIRGFVRLASGDRR